MTETDQKENDAYVLGLWDKHKSAEKQPGDYSLDDLAALLGKSRETVRTWLKDEVKAGRLVRVVRGGHCAYYRAPSEG